MGVFKSIKTKVGKIKKELIVLSIAFKDNRTPLVAKLIIIITISYVLSPIDIIPDFIPVLGYLDDLIIIPLLISTAIRLIPNKVLDDSRKNTDKDYHFNRKIGYFAAFVIIIFWALFIGFLLNKLLIQSSAKNN